MTTTFAISNQKGGVAKTTSCFSLAACLAERGYKTLLVDLDPQAHLTMAAGYDPDEVTHSTADTILSQEHSSLPAELIRPTSMPGLDLLPGDLRLAQVERGFFGEEEYEYRLKHHLDTLASQYDFILLDCPPSMGSLTILALTAADYALVPVQCEYFASRGLLRLLDIIQAVRQHTNPRLDYYIFITMFDGRNLISRRVLEELRQHFEDRLFQTVIRMDTRLRESPIAGEPVVVYAPKTRASQEYRSLSDEILSRIPKKEKAS